MKKKYILIALAGLFLTSCTEDVMDRINNDEAHPNTVNGKFQITDAIMSTAFTTISGNYAWYASTYTELETGTGNNQLKNAELRNTNETASPSTFNNEWNGTYANMLNIKKVMEKCATGGINSDQYDLLGMAQVLMAVNAGVMTDLHGDIPYTEAISGSLIKNPKLTPQKEIYDSIQSLLDKAIVNFTKGSSLKSAGLQDLLFNNDNGQWVAYAHALKARYYLHTYGRNKEILPTVISEANAAIAAGFDGVELDVFNGSNAINPWTAFFGSRQYTGSSSTVANLMNERNDNRISVYNYDMFQKNVLGIPGDKEQANMTNVLNAPSWLANQSASVHMLSKAELYFILAEAKVRSGLDGLADFNMAVAASFDDYDESNRSAKFVNNAAEYIAGLATNYAANPLKEIMVQKYISQARDEQIEAWNDLRRCEYVDGASFVAMTNPHNSFGGKNQLPLRLPYGQSDVVSNSNVQAAFGTGNEAGAYLFTENIWIFGGSR